LATLRELQLATLNVLPIAYARGSALVIVLGDSRVKESEKGETCPIFKEDIVGACLAGASVTKTAPLLGVRERQFPRLCRRTRIMGRHQRRGTVGESQYRRALRRIVSTNHRTATQVTGQQN
jgi:hypothetical protein